MSKKNQGQDFYVFGEFWNGNEEENNIYLEKIEKSFWPRRCSPPQQSTQG